MEKKAVIFGSIIVILGGVVFLMQWRSHVIGPGARLSAGALVAISADGTPMPAPAAQAAGNRLPENTAIQETGGRRISLTLNPYPPTVATASVFEVRVTDANGQAISGATIRLDLTMPGMVMPPNQFSLEPDGADMYQATGRFTMRGPWRIEVIITLDGKTQSVFFDVWL